MRKEMETMVLDVEQVTVPCKLCGDPVTVSLPENEDEFRKAIERLLPLATHNRCYDKRQVAIRAREKVAWEAVKLKRWELMCPPEYRKKLDWRKKNCSEVVFRRVMRWERGPKGLMLRGSTGLCKTRFMWKLLEREFNSGVTVAFYSHADFRRKVATLAQDDMNSCKRFIDGAARVSILCIDDLGLGHVTPASEEAFESLLEARASKGLPVMFTTNLSVQDLEDNLSPVRGQAIMRRIVEHTEQVEFDAEGGR